VQRASRLWTAWLIAALAVAFVSGLQLGHRLTIAASPSLLRVAQLLPAAVRYQKAPDIAPATDLRPLATFWEVREKIKANFVYPIEDDAKLTYGAIRGMLEALDEPYSRFLTPTEYQNFQAENEQGHFSGIGAILDRYRDADTGEWTIIISAVLPDGPAAKSGLRARDIILAVDDKPVAGMPLGRVVEMIRGKAGTKVKLTVQRKGVKEPLDLEIVRGDVQVPAVEYEMLPGQIGYVWLRTFNRSAADKMREALTTLRQQGMKALLLDLSLDQGGILDVAIDIADMFIDKGPLVWIRERGAEPQPVLAHKEDLVPKDLPMVCLIDNSSASAAEILAGCLQDTGRALVVGQHSFGKSTVQTVIELSDHSALVLTTAIYLTPNKRNIGEAGPDGKRGVKPDVVFSEGEPDQRVSYTDWHDQQKQRALAELRKRMAGQVGKTG
jgi:carboxyl-terminal processing protease